VHKRALAAEDGRVGEAQRQIGRKKAKYGKHKHGPSPASRIKGTDQGGYESPTKGRKNHHIQKMTRLEDRQAKYPGRERQEMVEGKEKALKISFKIDYSALLRLRLAMWPRVPSFRSMGNVGGKAWGKRLGGSTRNRFEGAKKKHGLRGAEAPRTHKGGRTLGEWKR